MQFFEKIWENSMLPLPPNLNPRPVDSPSLGKYGIRYWKYTVNGPIILIKNFYKMILKCSCMYLEFCVVCALKIFISNLSEYGLVSGNLDFSKWHQIWTIVMVPYSNYNFISLFLRVVILKTGCVRAWWQPYTENHA